MAGEIYRYLTSDHAQLDDALRRATSDADHIDRSAYAEFREGLLRHIGMEATTRIVQWRSIVIRRVETPRVWVIL